MRKIKKSFTLREDQVKKIEIIVKASGESESSVIRACIDAALNISRTTPSEIIRGGKSNAANN
jgi:hypothetical protein